MRSVRSVFRLTRLAVTLATQPLANLRRALAISSLAENTGAPTASIVGDRGIDQRQDDVDVVDHQIEHDAHVRAPLRERRDSDGFDIDWPSDARRDGAEGVGEAFDQADLKYQLLGPGQRREFFRIGHALCEGFFDQHVDPGVEEVPHHFVVRGGRHGDRHGVDAADERAVVGCCLGLQTGRDLGGPWAVAVGNRDQAGAVESSHLFRVIAAEVTDADDA